MQSSAVVKFHTPRPVGPKQNVHLDQVEPSEIKLFSYLAEDALWFNPEWWELRRRF